jgi:hypothetical protein
VGWIHWPRKHRRSAADERLVRRLDFLLRELEEGRLLRGYPDPSALCPERCSGGPAESGEREERQKATAEARKAWREVAKLREALGQIQNFSDCYRAARIARAALEQYGLSEGSSTEPETGTHETPTTLGRPLAESERIPGKGKFEGEGAADRSAETVRSEPDLTNPASSGGSLTSDNPEERGDG